MANEVDDDGIEQSNAEMEAAFAASFDAESAKTTEAPKTDDAQAKVEDAPSEGEGTAAAPVEGKKDEPATPSAPPVAALSADQVRLLATLPELEKRLTQQVDKVAGNYGEIKRLVDTMKSAAATPQGAAAFQASEDADYLDREYPALAGEIKSRIDKAVANVKTGISEEEFEQRYERRRARDAQVRMNEMIDVLESDHPDRVEIQKTPQWATWMQTLSPAQKRAVTESEDGHYVSSMLFKFKDYRDQQAAAAAKSKQRIEAALTPTGTRAPGHQITSDEDAAQRAFDAQFQ